MNQAPHDQLLCKIEYLNSLKAPIKNMKLYSSHTTQAIPIKEPIQINELIPSPKIPNQCFQVTAWWVKNEKNKVSIVQSHWMTMTASKLTWVHSKMIPRNRQRGV